MGKGIDMTVYWNVPYVGQVGFGADLHGNDCGPASAAMIIKWAGIAVPTIDTLFDEVQPNGDNYTSFGDLMRLLERRGIDSDFDAGLATKDLYWILASGKPIIALIHYGSLRTIRPNRFTGNHFVVVIGIDLDTVYIHDPLNTPTTGECIKVPMKMFEEAWSTAIDSNRAIIIPSKSTGLPPVLPGIIKTVTPRDWNGCNVRRIPGLLTNANKVYGIVFGANINIYEINSDNWGKISPTREEWISLDYTVDVK